MLDLAGNIIFLWWVAHRTRINWARMRARKAQFSLFRCWHYQCLSSYGRATAGYRLCFCSIESVITHTVYVLRDAPTGF